jgi:hypothetical protein
MRAGSGLHAPNPRTGPPKLQAKVAASKQFALLMVGKFSLGGILAGVGQFSPYRSPGHSQRTRGTDGANKRERGGDCQHLSPAKGHGITYLSLPPMWE